MTPKDKPAMLIIDMVKDSFDEGRELKIASQGRKIIQPIKDLAATFREKGWPVVFATDSFGAEDFIFTGRMKPTSLEGTEGAEVIDELERQPDDLWLKKPRFSAFHKTDLEQWLKQRKITLCAVAGIATPICVLATALDAIACDFKATLLADCTAAVSEEIHGRTLELYRRTALYPLLKVATASEFLSGVGID